MIYQFRGQSGAFTFSAFTFWTLVRAVVLCVCCMCKHMGSVSFFGYIWVCMSIRENVKRKKNKKEQHIFLYTIIVFF